MEDKVVEDKISTINVIIWIAFIISAGLNYMWWYVIKEIMLLGRSFEVHSVLAPVCVDAIFCIVVNIIATLPIVITYAIVSVFNLHEAKIHNKETDQLNYIIKACLGKIGNVILYSSVTCCAAVGLYHVSLILGR